MIADDMKAVEVDHLLAEATWLRALARSLAQGAAGDDDAVQDVWLAALRSPPDRGRPARPWLAQVLRNVLRSAARRLRAQRTYEAEALRRAPQVAPSIEDDLERRQLEVALAEGVLALAEPYR